MRVLSILLVALVGSAQSAAFAEVPESVEIAAELGRQSLAVGEIEQAKSSFESALRLAPEHVPSLLGLSQVYERQGDLMAALASAREAERLEPGNLEPVLAVGRLLIGLGAREEALAMMERAREIDPTNMMAVLFSAVGLRYLDRTAEAIELLEDALARGLQAVPLLEQLCSLLLSEGRPERALELAEPAAARMPRRAELALLVGMALAKSPSRRSEAAGWIEKALDLGVSSQVRAHLELSSVLGEVGRSGEAVDHLRRAAAIAPDHAEIQYRLGIALREQGEPDQAQQALERYQELSRGPDGDDVLEREMGVALNEVEDLAIRQRTEEALIRVDELLATYGEVIPALLLKAKVLHSARRFEEALVPIERALELVPGLAEPHRLEGLLLIELGRPAEAVERLRRALDLETGNIESHAYLARALARLGRHAEAAEMYARAFELGADQTRLRLEYAATLDALGRREEAEKQRDALRNPSGR